MILKKTNRPHTTSILLLVIGFHVLEAQEMPIAGEIAPVQVTTQEQSLPKQNVVTVTPTAPAQAATVIVPAAQSANSPIVTSTQQPVIPVSNQTPAPIQQAAPPSVVVVPQATVAQPPAVTTPQPTTITVPSQTPSVPSSTPQVVVVPAPTNPEKTTVTVMQSEVPAVAEKIEITSDVPLSSEEEVIADPEITGIDTVQLEDPQGNWLFKRIWWERSQERYEKIRTLVDQLWDSRMSFFVKRSDVDRTVLDPFYMFVGVSRGELQEMIASLITELDEEEAKEHELGGKERALYNDLKEEKKIVEELSDQVNLVMELDHNLDDALEKLMDQLNKARSYERDAWGDLKKISMVLSDAKARELYYRIDVHMRNIKDVHRYIQNDFNRYFEDIVDRINTNVQKLKLHIQALREKGIDFKNAVDQALQEDEAIEKEAKDEAITVDEGPGSDIDADDDEPAVQKGIMTRITNGLYTVMMQLNRIIMYPVHWVTSLIGFGGGKN